MKRFLLSLVMLGWMTGYVGSAFAFELPGSSFGIVKSSAERLSIALPTAPETDFISHPLGDVFSNFKGSTGGAFCYVFDLAVVSTDQVKAGNVNAKSIFFIGFNGWLNFDQFISNNAASFPQGGWGLIGGVPSLIDLSGLLGGIMPNTELAIQLSHNPDGTFTPGIALVSNDFSIAPGLVHKY